MARKRRRRLLANVRYLFALLSRFKLTVGVAAVLFGIAPLIYRWRYVGPTGERIDYGQALSHVYFLMFGQPTLPFVDNWLIEVLNVAIPPIAIAVVVDGIVRFAYLYFAKHHADKDWITVITKTFEDHVIICGAGRVGYRVATRLIELGKEVVVIEKREDAAFVSVLRDADVPLLIDDIKSPQALARTNVKKASALVCATDDDLANLNVALDARKENPNIRVVIRLFDDDLVAKVRDTFKAEALSSSALAAPAMALAALDPRILHSFEVVGRLMVVSNFEAQAALSKLTLADVRDQFGGLTLALKKGDGPPQLHPNGQIRVQPTDVLTVQSEYQDYLRLRSFTGEETPPTAPVR